MFQKMKNFIKEHTAEIMIANLLFAFVVIMMTTILALTGIITINEIYALFAIAVSPMALILVFGIFLL